MSTPTLSIVIITLNEAQRLPRLLDDLATQSFQDFEIIHVDSNSDDDTVALSHAAASRFAQYRVIEMQTRGVSLGRNTGAAAAQGDRLLFLDADTRLDPAFLAESLTELDHRQLDVGVVCMDTAGLPRRLALGYGIFNLGIRITLPFFPTAIGACLFSTPAVHQRIGGFDEGLSLCEDCNYVLKAAEGKRTTLGILRARFGFDPRRLDQDGTLRTGLTYLRANLRRFFRGEMYKNEIPYAFGHYK